MYFGIWLIQDFLEEQKKTFENGEELFNSEQSKQKLNELLEKKTLSFSDQGKLLIYIKKFAENGSFSAKKLLANEVSKLLINNALKWTDRIVFGGYYKYLSEDLLVEILSVPNSQFL